MRIVNARKKDKGGGIMKQFLKRIRQDNKGFTLVELLIVVAILGVLASAVLISASAFTDEGEVEAALAEKKLDEKAISDAMDEMVNDITEQQVKLMELESDLNEANKETAELHEQLEAYRAQGSVFQQMADKQN